MKRPPIGAIDALERGWLKFKPAAGECVGVVLLGFVLAFMAQMVGAAVMFGAMAVLGPSQLVMVGGQVVTLLSVSLIAAFVQMGQIAFFLQIIRRGHASVGEMFTQGRKLPQALVVQALTTAAVYLGLLLLVIPGLIIALGTAYSLAFVVDRDLTPLEAIQASWRTTLGYKGLLFRLGLLSPFVFFAGLLACFFGLLVAIPVMWLAVLWIYMRLSSMQQAKHSPAPEPDLIEDDAQLVDSQEEFEVLPDRADGEKPLGGGFPLKLTAPPRAAWVDLVASVLLLPLLLAGSSPFVAIFAGMALSKQLAHMPFWTGIGFAMGGFVLPALAALVLLVHANRHQRPRVIEDGGVVFARNSRWNGHLVEWSKIAGFRVVPRGVMLTLRGRWWTRWLGPVLPASGLLTHRLVEMLEERGVYRLDG